MYLALSGWLSIVLVVALAAWQEDSEQRDDGEARIQSGPYAEVHPLDDDGGGPSAWLGFFNGNCATPFAGPHAGNSGYQGLHTGARTAPPPPFVVSPEYTFAAQTAGGRTRLSVSYTHLRAHET